MDIKLCYVEGISSVDTPDFTSVSAQETFFNNKVKVTINDAYYPPKFRNSINISSDDIDLYDTIVFCNYLFFEYGNKRYYYFIEDIEYVNENLWNVNIVMDVIQTYMFNLRIVHGNVQRKCIKQYNVSGAHYYINRDYIRENVSEGFFIKGTKTVRYANGESMTLVIKMSGLSDYGTTDIGLLGVDNPHFITKVGNKGAFSGFGYLFVPLIDTLTTIQYTSSNLTYQYNVQLDRILQYVDAFDAYVVPTACLSQLFTISNDKTKIILNNSYKYACKDFYVPSDQYIKYSEQSWPDNPGVIGYDPYPYNVKCCINYKQNGGLLFGTIIPVTGNDVISSELNVLRYVSTMDELAIEYPISIDNNVHYINTSVLYRQYPQLVDDNYYRLIFGTDTNNIAYPLFEGYNEVYSYVTFDISLNIDNGSYTFSIGNDYTANYSNNLDTIIVAPNSMNVDLITNYYKEYASSNKSRWVSALINTGVNAVEYILPIAGKASHMKGALFNILSNEFNSSTDMKSAKATQRIRDIKNDFDSSLLGSSARIATLGDPLLQQGMQEYNMQHKPLAPKQTGMFITTYNSKQFVVWSRLDTVQDFDRVVQYYHRNGFKVDLPINNIDPTTDTVFREFRVKKLFNIVKFNECDIEILNCINDIKTIDLIKERLTSGIRLWNMSHNVKIGQFEYNNPDVTNY